MKTIVLSIAVISAVALLPSCAGLEIVTHTPYGSGSYKDGVITASPAPHPHLTRTSPAPRPIVVPIYGTK